MDAARQHAVMMPVVDRTEVPFCLAAFTVPTAIRMVPAGRGPGREPGAGPVGPTPVVALMTRW